MELTKAQLQNARSRGDDTPKSHDTKILNEKYYNILLEQKEKVSLTQTDIWDSVI